MPEPERPRRPDPARLPKLLRWPPYPGHKYDHPHPPGGRCLNRCYCGRCPHFVPVRPAPPTESRPPQ